MEKVFEIETPCGKGTIQYGHFMPDDDRGDKFHCWWNGCGIGGKSKSINDAKKYLLGWIDDRLHEILDEYEEKSTDIRVFLRDLK